MQQLVWKNEENISGFLSLVAVQFSLQQLTHCIPSGKQNVNVFGGNVIQLGHCKFSCDCDCFNCYYIVQFNLVLLISILFVQYCQFPHFRLACRSEMYHFAQVQTCCFVCSVGVIVATNVAMSAKRTATVLVES